MTMENGDRIPDSPAMRIYDVVKQIPRGQVATYAQVAEAAGNRKMARAVGNALHKNPDPDRIPCYRVVNAKGELAAGFAFGGAGAQAERLMAEGVEVTDGRVSLQKYGWHRDLTSLESGKSGETYFASEAKPMSNKSSSDNSMSV